jgi:hypothetical protein
MIDDFQPAAEAPDETRRGVRCTVDPIGSPIINRKS